MAEGASKYLFLCLLFGLSFCTSGTTQVGFSYDARKHNAISSPVETILSSLKLNKVSPSQIRVFVADHQVLNSLSNNRVSVDIFLNQTLVENLQKHKPSTLTWLKTHLTTFFPHVNINSIIVSGSKEDLPGENDFHMLLSTLTSINSVLSSFHLKDKLKASVSFSLSFLENLNRQQKRDLHKVLNFIKKVGSFVLVEATVDGELSMGDGFVQHAIQRATSAAYSIPGTDVSIVLTIKSSVVPSAIEVSEFTEKILRSLKNCSQVTGKITHLFAEVSLPKEFEQKELVREEEQMFHSSHRELLDHFHYKTTQHDTVYPPVTTFPTTPVTVPPDNNPTPTIVTVPSTIPVTVTPNPAYTPVTIPSTTPVTTPSTDPVNSPVPITNPVTTPGTVPGAQPITNPVTTFPAPTTGVPVTTPVTNPVASPTTTGTPAVSGQSWCVVKSGTLETALQAALDYACGIGGADCSTIQEGASCYNPNTLENHASYAFNSYFQKNPMQTSCDFGGSAMITNMNPSTGTCIYPASSSSPMTATPTTASSSGATVPGYSGSPPSVLNTGDPASGGTTVYGESPPGVNSTTSIAASLQPFIGCIIIVTSVVTGRFILEM